MSLVVNEEIEGIAIEKVYIFPVKGPPWMHDLIEEYTNVIYKKFRAKRNSNSHLTEEDIEDIHKRGVDKVMKLFREYKNSSNENTLKNDNMEQELEVVLEENVTWVRDVHKYLGYMEKILKEIIEQGEEPLKTKLTFNPSPTVKYLNDLLITSIIDNVIKDQIAKFHEKVSLGELQKIVLSYKERYEAIIQLKLGKTGKDERDKYLAALDSHVKLKTEKCISIYKSEMEGIMVTKGLEDMEEIEDLHFLYTGKSLEMLVDEIGINAQDHFSTLSFSTTHIFENLMLQKKEELMNQCLSDVRNIFSRRHIPYEGGSEEEIQVLAMIKNSIKNAVEDTMEVVSQSAGLIDVTVTNIDLDSSNSENPTMDEDKDRDSDDYSDKGRDSDDDSEKDRDSDDDSDDEDIQVLGTFHGEVTNGGNNVEENEPSVEDTSREKDGKNCKSNSNAKNAVSTSTQEDSVRWNEATVENRTITNNERRVQYEVKIKEDCMTYAQIKIVWRNLENRHRNCSFVTRIFEKTTGNQKGKAGKEKVCETEAPKIESSRKRFFSEKMMDFVNPHLSAIGKKFKISIENRRNGDTMSI